MSCPSLALITALCRGGWGSDDLVTHCTYTLHGLIDKMTDPLLRVTDYYYGSLGRVTKAISAKGTQPATT